MKNLIAAAFIAVSMFTAGAADAQGRRNNNNNGNQQQAYGHAGRDQGGRSYNQVNRRQSQMTVYSHGGHNRGRSWNNRGRNHYHGSDRGRFVRRGHGHHAHRYAHGGYGRRY